MAENMEEADGTASESYRIRGPEPVYMHARLPEGRIYTIWRKKYFEGKKWSRR